VSKKIENPAAEAAERVRESAQQIWLAGLGAFAKAQQEGGKVFESLVQDGVNLQRKTQTVAQERMAQATERITEMAGGLSAKAGQQWGRLEGIFEERVARALTGLSVPTAAELQVLKQRIQALETQVQALQASGKTVPASRKSASRTTVDRKTPPRKVAAGAAKPKTARRGASGG
jgi:poly(hydroxyalkanoate) granule-associated protein